MHYSVVLCWACLDANLEMFMIFQILVVTASNYPGCLGENQAKLLSEAHSCGLVECTFASLYTESLLPLRAVCVGLPQFIVGGGGIQEPAGTTTPGPISNNRKGLCG